MHDPPNKDGESPGARHAVAAAPLGSDFEFGALLAGLVIDTGGAEMLPRRNSGPNARRFRYYVSSAATPALGTPERIEAVRLDRSVIAILRRVRLLGEERQRERLRALIKRVLILDDAIILQLNKRLCLTAWRAQASVLQRLSTGDVLRSVGTCLARDEELTEAGTTLCLRVPRRARKSRSRRPRKAPLFQPTD